MIYVLDLSLLFSFNSLDKYLADVDHVSFAGLEKFKVTQELLPALVGP